MDRTQRRIARRPRLACYARVAGLVGATVALATLALDCCADSALQQGSAAGGAVSASAHLDFRVVVLPSVALSMQAAGVRVQGNGGALTVQRSAADAADGQAPNTSLRISQRRRATDTPMQLTAAAAGDLITVASP